MQLQSQYLPIYFGNVCLRFLPVFDIVIHRFLELLPVSKSLETLLDHLGSLYKFHGELGCPEVRGLVLNNRSQCEGTSSLHRPTCHLPVQHTPLL